MFPYHLVSDLIDKGAPMEDIRRLEFPQTNRLVYLNTAGEGLLPKRALKQLSTVMGRVGRCEVSDEEVFELMKNLRREAAKVIGAKPGEIALTTSTTTGLKSILSLLHIKKGDNIVSFDLEFPTVGAAVISICRRTGCKVKVVRNKGGIYTLEDIEKIVDENTKAIVLSSVEWVNGYRFNLRAVAEIAEKVGAYLIVDAVQHIGALRINVHKEGVDFLAAGGEKWLLAPLAGCGILYVRSDLIEKYEPLVYGLMNLEEPEEGWSRWWSNPGKDPWSTPMLTKTAVRYEWGGTPPLPGIVILYEAVKLLNSIGIADIERRNFMLKEYLIDQLSSIGARIVSYVDDTENWSSITTFRLKERFDEDCRIVDSLRGKGIIVAARGSTGICGIRVSPHFYNDREDIDMLVENLRRFR